MGLFFFFRRGHADAEIEAVFAKYDVDGDRVLDEEECKKMQEDLEGQKVLLKTLDFKNNREFLFLFFNNKRPGLVRSQSGLYGF